jgi:glutathione S-transferase
MFYAAAQSNCWGNAKNGEEIAGHEQCGSDDLQQELFFLVVARLAFVPDGGLDFAEESLSVDDTAARAELLLMSPSFLVPCLRHNGIKVWDTLALGEYLNETFPAAGLLPEELGARTHCRAISGEMHSGFSNLRSALPMNLRAHYPEFKIWTAAQADIDRIVTIWRECFGAYHGPYLFGALPTLADAMYAPVATRFQTYDVKLDRFADDYCKTLMALPDMIAWVEAAKAERVEVEELEAEF